MDLTKTFSCIAIIIAGLLLIEVSCARAEAPHAVNFMVDKKGTTIQISMVSLGKKPALNRGFPLEDSNRGLLLMDFNTGAKIAELKPEKRKTGSLIAGAYALDDDRIVINFFADIGLWNYKTNSFTLFRGKGSGESGYGLQISGVHPDERLIISCFPFSPVQRGIFLHDIRSGSTTRLFMEYEHILSPRFSPDGAAYAFFAGMNAHTKNEKHYLVMQSLISKEPLVYEFEDGDLGIDLSWSPSGKYLAGNCRTRKAKSILCIWNRSGKLIARIPESFFSKSGWAPVWMPDEKGIVIFYTEKRKEEKKFRLLKQEFVLTGYGL